jgi:thiol-disulfide isomerase/thioredoxin
MSDMSDDNFDPDFYDILYLEDNDFHKDGTLKKLPKPYGGKPVSVMVFANWCGPCKMTKPEYKKLKDMVDDKVVIACINGSGKGTLPSEQKLMERIKEIFPDFRGFPHIAVFNSNGKLAKTHEGPRKAQNIMETIKNVN